MEIEDRKKVAKDFKKKHALEVEDDTAAITIHLMNQHRLDEHAALDQSSRGGNDEGIDGWYFDEKSLELYVYQSKFSSNKRYVLQGFSDILKAKNWLESVLITGEIKKTPTNTGLYNLYITLGKNKENITKITFILTSLINENELEDEKDYTDCKRELINSNLNKHVKIDLKLAEHNFDDTSLPMTIKTYPITRIEGSTINLPDSSSLDLAYVPLNDLVELYRRRGYLLFDKNIRLSISNTKEARERLVHPMEETLKAICEGKLNPNVFTFYHVGVTIAATKNVAENKDLLLEYPNIINGCQTITIADSFLKELEKDKDYEKIGRFKEIKVIAKIVIGVPDDELRQITNSNNRQNPIDNWQLFSNDPIHIEIEEALENVGIFYERQKGKFDTVMKKPEIAKKYPSTNNTFVTVFDLGQIICLSRRKLQWAAKPSEIFLNKKNHDSIFDKNIPAYAQDIILVSNVFKAMKRGLKNYLDNLTYSTEKTFKIFNKPLVKTYVYYVALMHFYQDKNTSSLREDFSETLNKIAPPTLVSEFETFFSKVVTKTRKWYVSESSNFKNEVSNKKLDEFLNDTSVELGVNLEGPTPFTKDSIDWS
ncbi:MAG: AIPR family protein [Candidatus Bathyarchaeia archaeon]